MTSSDDAEQRSYRSCGQCGWSGETAESSCPGCGTDWFLTPDGEVNGFAE